MKYNYTDTFRSTLELATEQALQLGRSEITPELLLWGILKEGTSTAINVLSELGVSSAQLMTALETQIAAHPEEASREEEPMGEASIYSIEAHEVLARAARICTILDNSAISPLHLLLSIYYSESYTFLSDYLSEGPIPESWQQRLSEIKQRLSQAAESAPAPSEALEQPEEQASAPAALEEQAANPLEELKRLLSDPDLPIGISKISIISPRKGRSTDALGKRRPEVHELRGREAQDLLDRLLGASSADEEEPTKDAQAGEDDTPESPAEQRLRRERRQSEALQPLGEVIRLLSPCLNEYQLPTPLQRGEELDQLKQALIRQRLRIPLLVGPAHVGKTSLLLRLALDIEQSCVPEGFPYEACVLLDFAKLQDSLLEYGSHELALQQLIGRMRRHPEVLLLIDGLEYFVSRRAQGIELLTPLLLYARELRIPFVATTSPEGYRQITESNSIARSLLEPIMLEPLPKGEGRQRMMHQSLHELRKAYQIDIKPEEQELIYALCERYLGHLPQPHALIELLERAAAITRLRVGTLPRSGVRSKRRLYPEDLYKAVAQLTQLPLERISTKGELEQLRRLPERLKAQVLGQDEAVLRIAHTIQRARLGLGDEQRPASFFFLGPTGVGKTYLAKTLARELFGSEDAMVRIDMSEFAEAFAVTRLIGAPPGYIGYGKGGELTEPVRTKPYRIILLDELEKAHPDVYNILLQLLEDGRLTDTEGQVVDFRHTIIIMTSNIGSREAKDFAHGLGYTPEDSGRRSEAIVRKALGRRFSPEFIGRVDEFITFAPLDDATLTEILALELRPLIEHVRTLGYGLSLTSEARQWLALHETDRAQGARPLRRRLRREVEDPLMDYILSEELQPGQSLAISLRDGALHYEITPGIVD